MLRCEFSGNTVLVRPRCRGTQYIPRGVVSDFACVLHKQPAPFITYARAHAPSAAHAMFAYAVSPRLCIEVANLRGSWSPIGLKDSRMLLRSKVGRRITTSVWIRSRVGLSHRPVILQRTSQCSFSAMTLSTHQPLLVRTVETVRRYTPCLRRYTCAPPGRDVAAACSACLGGTFALVPPSEAYTDACARFLREACVHDTERVFVLYERMADASEFLHESRKPSGNTRMAVLATLAVIGHGDVIASQSIGLTVAVAREADA